MARSKGRWNKIDNTNDVWDLVEISNGAKIVDCNGSTIQNVTSMEIWKAIKCHLWRKELREENE
jgi:hypothetical protein